MLLLRFGCFHFCLHGIVFQEITDESSGYVNNGVVMLEALVKVELPKNL